jgi:hypothetical protein
MPRWGLAQISSICAPHYVIELGPVNTSRVKCLKNYFRRVIAFTLLEILELVRAELLGMGLGETFGALGV